VVPRLGGFVDFFDDECAVLVDPKMAYYVLVYYTSKELRDRHGVTARKKTLQHYAWEDHA